MWYEYLIAAVAMAIVALPIIRHFVNKKKGKSSCGCDLGCSVCNNCCCDHSDRDCCFKCGGSKNHDA